MSKLLKIVDTSSVNKTLKKFLDPNYTYIPYDKKYKLNIKNHDKVCKEEIILNNEKDYIYSTTSGFVEGICKMSVDNIDTPCIIIANDFKEKTKKIKCSNKIINNFTVDEVNNLINGLNAYNGSLFGETMIINGIDEEPFEYTKSHIINEYTDEILECIDALFNIFNVHKCFFTLKNTDSKNVDALVNYIGTYPNINLKLMPDLYPLGKKEVLINELISDNKKDKGIIFLNVEDVLRIYNVLKRHKPITEKLVTVGSLVSNKTKVLKVKIGTSIKDILNNEFNYDGEEEIIINGLLSGYKLKNKNAIITPNTRSVFILKNEIIKEKQCINCGMCNLYCPNKCDPKNNRNMESCINCGLCSYICPSKINRKENNNEEC